MSTATNADTSAGGAGVNLLGQYCEDSPTNVRNDRSIQTKQLVAQFPLTYRIGHPYYSTPEASSAERKFGQLQGKSWGEHVRSVSTPIFQFTRGADLKPFAKGVLLVDGTGHTAAAPLVVRLSGNVELRGIVVRRGGILLIDEDVPTTLKVNFVLVESGGLLQAGSPDKPTHRYGGTLQLIMTHPPDGYKTMPVVASQYPYHVYAPGVKWLLDSEPQPPGGHGRDIFAGFDGTAMCFTNAFCAKTIAVGFNGNCVLCGSITKPVPYAGTWKSLKNGQLHTNGPESLTVSDVDGHFLKKDYPLTWARLAPLSGAKGSTTLRLHPDDVAGLSLADIQQIFKAGADTQVVVTTSSSQYTSQGNASGLFPLFIADKHVSADTDGTENMRQNTAALNSKEFLEPNRGVEVVVVLQVVRASSSPTTFDLVLRDKLRFDHALAQVDLVNAAGQSVQVEVTHHVGILTRNIVIDGQDVASPAALAGGRGCNVLAGPQAQAREMGLGLGNQTAQVMMRPMATLMGHTAEAMLGMGGLDAEVGEPVGSGGALGFNYVAPISPGPGGREVTGFCYTPDAYAADGTTRLTGKGTKPPPGQEVPGSWLFGTAGGGRGCNVILGGSCMFRYGSSVCLDGVEIVRMGIAPNFGTIGQYSVHFHLFGFAKSFRGYLRSANHPRDAVVRNCSIWRSYSRFVTMHGACEVDVCNNVGCITYGSAFFVEDGTEQLNAFEHNLACCVFPSVTNAFFNPQPIYANVSTDYCTFAVFWLKSSMNVVARNVACCCPGNGIAVWYVPQEVGGLRGPSAVCFGSEDYELPACGSLQAITTTGLGTANHPPVTNKGGALVQFKKGASCGGGQHCACWVPPGFSYPFTDPMTGCSAMTGDNGVVPILLNAENVAYCIAGFHSEFPESIKGGPATFETTSKEPFYSASAGCGWGVQDEMPRPMFLPLNGQNACSDNFISSYPPTKWPLDDFKFQPLSAQDQERAKNDCMQWSDGGSPTLAFNLVPKIFSGILTFNLGTSNGLWGGAGWTKQHPPMLLNCCFLETSHRTMAAAGDSTMAMDGPTTSRASYPAWGSTFWADSTNTDNDTTFPNLYVVKHNFLTNGSLSLSSNVSVFTGDKTWFDARTTVLSTRGAEYVQAAGATLAVAVFDFDFSKVFAGVFDHQGQMNPASSPWNRLQIFNYKDMSYWRCQIGTNSDETSFSKAILTQLGSFKAPPQQDGVWPGRPTKYPFMCGGSKDGFGLLRTSDAEAPLWSAGVAINALTAHFSTPRAQGVGDRVCRALSQTWSNLQSVDSNGATRPFVFPKSWQTVPEACSRPAAFR